MADSLQPLGHTELLQRLQDQEQTIAQLHRQQRDVRFLGKQLIVELQLRLNKRAKGIQPGSGLRYRSDNQVRQALTEEGLSEQQLIDFIQEHDKANIGRQKTAVKQVTKGWFWKITAVIFDMLLFAGKKVARRVR